MAAPVVRVLLVVLILFLDSNSGRRIGKKEMKEYRQRVVDMFHHAYDGYIQYGYPYDELRPITCDGHDTWGSYSLTLIDALDMLVVMGNNTEFHRVAKLVMSKMNFNVDINVSVFETNIRVVGGLLSAHLLSKRAGMDLEPGWPCSGPFLSMAEDVARRLLPAFDTDTGMPYGTVNLMYGVPKGETTVTCTAGVATFIVEFGALSKLTGDPIFEKVAMRALRALWKARSTINLVGNHIDVSTGKWTALDGGIGGGIDSYFEYLVKGSIMLNKPELLQMFHAYLPAIEKYLKRDDWYMWAHMTKGNINLPVFTSLDCYWPGIQAMLGDIDKAMKTIHNFHQVWKQFGFLPEFYNIVKNEAHAGREGYPLRPELVESAMYLYQATKDPYLLEIGVDMLESIEHNTRTKCGYATVKDVNSHTLENRMESFFLAETTKYLYLLFDEDNFIHNTGGTGTVVQTPNGECVIDAGGYIFNSEAHPVDMAALHCCSAEKQQEDEALQNLHDNFDLLALLDINDRTDTVQGVRWSELRKRPPVENEFDSDSVVTSTLLDSVTGSKQSEHQNILSTEGKVFKVKVDQPNTVKVIIEGSKTEPSKVTPDQSETSDPSTEACAEGGSAKKGECSSTEQEGKEKYLKSEGIDSTEGCESEGEDEPLLKPPPSGATDSSRQTSADDDDSHGDTFREDFDEEEDEETQTSESISDTKTLVQGLQPDFNVKPQTQTVSSNINDVLKLLQSFTSELLQSGTQFKTRTLREKLKYYSLFQPSQPALMTCKAQPFHMAMSVMGEMFVDQ